MRRRAVWLVMLLMAAGGATAQLRVQPRDVNSASGLVWHIGGVTLGPDGAMQWTGMVPLSQLGSGTPSASTYLRGDGTWQPISGAPVGATYVTQTPDGTLSNEFALSTLSTGLLKVTTGTGALSTAVAGTDYVVPSALAAYAPVNSPTLTGDPKAPTPSTGDNDTSIATTAFVYNNAPALNGYLAYNHTFYSRRLYQAEVHNSFFMGASRFTVTQTGIPSGFSAPTLFDGNYDNSSSCTVPAAQTAVITIDLVDKGEFSDGNGVTYAGGYLYLSFYHDTTNYKAPASVSVRVRDKYDTWTNATTYTQLTGTTNQVVRVTIPISNWLEAVEITFTAQGDKPATLSEVECALGRQSNAPQAVFAKGLNQSLYNTVTFKNASNVATASITSAGVITGASFVGPGSGLTALNASNLASGTVPTARLGSGTANSAAYLAGDSTWKTLNASAVGLGNVTNIAQAPVGATYITQTGDGTLSGEFALSTLSTGLLKVTTGTGALSTAVANTDYLPAASPTATGTTTVANLTTGGTVNLGFSYNSGTAQNTRYIKGYYIPRAADLTGGFMLDYQDELAYTASEGKGTCTLSVAPSLFNDTKIPFLDDATYCEWDSTTGLGGATPLVIEIDRTADVIAASNNPYYNPALTFRSNGAVNPTHIKVELTDSGGTWSTVFDQDVSVASGYASWIGPAVQAPSSNVYKIRLTLTIPSLGTSKFRLQRVMLYHVTHPLYDPWRLHIGGAAKGSRMCGSLEPYKTNSVNLGSSSRTWANVYATRMETKALEGTATKTLTDATATSLCDIALATGEMVGGTLFYTIKGSVDDDKQSRSGSVPFTAVNNGGAVTCAVGTPTDVYAGSSGTLTAAFSATAGTGKFTLKVTADSSLSSPTVTVTYWLQINGANAVTYL